MRCVNIIVDHPLYYHSKFVALSERMREQMQIFCIDRTHVAYLRRYYPEFAVTFLPLAGNLELLSPDDTDEQKLWSSEKTIKVQTMQREKDLCHSAEDWLRSRPYDLVFTGNYTPVEHLYRQIDACEPDYRTFYHEIMDDLIATPCQTMDETMERHIKSELGEVAPQDARSAIAGMVFVDICVRSYFREKIIRNLAENEIKVHVFGANWEKLPCGKSENIISSGREVDSRTCLRAISSSKISLNILPWFKDGAHDRVFTAMLCGAVSLTDDSRYLREQFADGEELVFFSLEQAKALPAMIRKLLEQPERMMQLAEKGQDKALAYHTWKNRAQELLVTMER
jgi:glycosyltransferase involved in cell wall biosynthesis